MSGFEEDAETRGLGDAESGLSGPGGPGGLSGLSGRGGSATSGTGHSQVQLGNEERRGEGVDGHGRARTDTDGGDGDERAGKFRCEGCGKEFGYSRCLMGGVELFRPRVCEMCRKIRLENAQNSAEAEAREERRRAWDRGQVVPPEYAATNPEHPLMNGRLLSGLMRYEGADGRGLGLWGESGLRKTRMICLVAKKLHIRGLSVAYVSAVRLGRAFQIMFAKGVTGDEARALIRQVHRADILVLDDLGKEPFTVHVGSSVYDLIERRTSFRKPILWTANMTGLELAGRMDPDQGGPIVRRLEDYCEVLHVVEEGEEV